MDRVGQWQHRPTTYQPTREDEAQRLGHALGPLVETYFDEQNFDYRPFVR